MPFFSAANILISILTITTIPTAQIVSLENKQDRNNEFYCGTLEDEYAVIVETPKGTKTLFTVSDWASASGWIPRKRCQTIAERFQKYYDRGSLGKMTTGEVNSYPVICVIEKKQEICNKTNLLFTLDRGVNAEQRLSNLRRPVPKQSQNASPSSVPSESPNEDDGRIFIDIEEMIEETPAENNNDWVN